MDINPTTNFQTFIGLLNNLDDYYTLDDYATNNQIEEFLAVQIENNINFQKTDAAGNKIPIILLSPKLTELHALISQINSLNDEIFIEFYNDPTIKPLLKSYVNSRLFDRYKFMFLSPTIKKYIILLFNSTKAVTFLLTKTSYIVYSFAEHYPYNNYPEDRIPSLYTFLLLRATKSNKLFKLIQKNIDYIDKHKTRYTMAELSYYSLAVNYSKIIKTTQPTKNFVFLLTNYDINRILKIITKMIQFAKENKDKSKAIKTVDKMLGATTLPGPDPKLKWLFDNKDIFNLVAKQIYTHSKGYAEQQKFLTKLLALHGLITTYKTTNFHFLAFFDKFLNKKIYQKNNSLRYPTTPHSHNHYPGQLDYMETNYDFITSWILYKKERDLLLYPTDYDTRYIEYPENTANSLSSNSHLNYIYAKSAYELSANQSSSPGSWNGKMSSSSS
jgi:hypothetical protein